MNAHWIETDQDYQYIVREGVVSGIIAQDDGVTLHVTETETGGQQTLCVIFEKSRFTDVSQAKEWLADKSRKSERRVFTKKAAYVTKKDVLGVDVGPMRPTEAQLEKINKFTRTEKTADEVVAIPTLACNDLIDRDIEAFTPKALRQMVELEGDNGIPGKSLMLSHNYGTLPTGRLFDAETTRRGGMNAVRIWTYVPNTDQYKSFIENIDYGLYWAVSVGLRLESVTCSICKSPFDWWFNWFCENGHEKGKYYDPNAEDGKAQMARSNDDGQLCFAKMENPLDFLELSVVFLGAQYSAEFEKSAGFFKAASADIRSNPDLQFAYDLSNQVSVKATELDEVMGLMQGTAVKPETVSTTVLTSPSATFAASQAQTPVFNITINSPNGDQGAEAAKLVSNLLTPMGEESKETHDKGGTGVNDTMLAALVLNVQSLHEQIELSTQELKKAALSLRTATEGDEAVEELLNAFDSEIESIEATLSAVEEVAELDAEDDDAVKQLIEEGKVASGAQLREAKTKLDSLNAEREEDQKKIAELQDTVSKLSIFAEAGEAYRDSLKNDIVETYRILQVGPGEPTGEVDASFAESLVEKVQDDVSMLEHLKGDYERQLKERFPGVQILRSTVEEDADVIPGVTSGNGEDDEKELKTTSGKSHRAVVGLHD